MMYRLMLARVALQKLGLAIGLWSALQPCAAHAQASHRLQWDPAWHRVGSFGYVLSGVSVLGAAVVLLLPGYPSESRWSGPVLFDNGVREALRARDPALRDAIRTASDITLLTTVLQTVMFDGLVIPLADHSPNLAAQLSLINVQAFALTTLVSTVLFKTVARARPLMTDCELNSGSDPLCKIGSYASFPSSHASTAFTAAGLSCAHHAALPLYGGAWDLAACLGSLAFATATGVFRIVGDRHYATDVLMGTAIGLTFGYLYPRLVHYRGDSERSVAAPPPSAAIPLFMSIGGTL